MTRTLSEATTLRFRAAIERRLGLRFEDAKLPFLATVLERRVAASRQPPETYVHALENAPGLEELGDLAREVTVPETYFFRNADQFHAFTAAVVPDLRRRGRARLRVLSAGCASGEEAYSTAILLHEAGVDASVVGVDLNPEMLERARRARYSAWALRETPVELERRWFRNEGGERALVDRAREAVHFEQQNLADEAPAFWGAASWNVVFCRNVLMYFAPDAARALIERIANALVPGGYLFLGHAETLRGLSNEFVLHHTHGTFYYQRSDRTRMVEPLDSPRERRSFEALASAISSSSTWVDSIREASQRVRSLSESTTESPPSPERWNLGAVYELLRSERYGAALDAVSALPEHSGRDPDVLLLRAALLVHRGDLALAEATCRSLLEIDGLNAGAHYLLALCREGAGDRAGAVSHDQTAVYLDPSFAMPRLHLGLLARRAGDREGARRELTLALALLEREDASRLLLFGGGFSRQSLVALCRAELGAQGGDP